MEATLRIIVEMPPAGVDYAVQKGKTAAHEAEQRQRSTGGDLQFDVVVKTERGDFRGPYVQGPKGGRFIYIGIGTAAGQFDSVWTRRLKVPLTGLTPEPSVSYQARISGTGRDGSPSCATIQPLGGWTPLSDI